MTTDENVIPPAPSNEPAEPTFALTVQPHAKPDAALLDTVHQWGRLMAQSGFFKDAKSEAQAAVKIMYGLEFGFSIGASMSGIHIIEGKPTLGAALQAAAVKRSGRYNYRTTRLDAQACTVEFFELLGGHWTKLGESTFTIEDARNAELLGRAGRMWEKYPRNMLFARAMTNGIGWFCPDVFEGGRVYTADELRPDIALTAEGDVIDVEAVAVEPPRPRPEPPRDAAPRERRAERPAAPTAIDRSKIENVGQLLKWAADERKARGMTVDTREVLRALQVEVVGEIGAKFKGRWPDAVAMIGAAMGFDAAHGGAEQAEIVEAEVTPAGAPDERLAALTAAQRVAYDELIGDGLDALDALTLAEANSWESPDAEAAPEA